MKNKNNLWYIKLSSRFFGDQEILDILSINTANFGRFFSCFVLILYFRMICHSVNNNGYMILYLDMIGSTNPANALAKKFFSSDYEEDVQRALIILEREGLIEINANYDNNAIEIYIPYVENNIGRNCISQELKEQRKIENKERIRNELIAEKKNIKKEKKKPRDSLNKVMLTDSEYSELSAKVADLDKQIELLAFTKIMKDIEITDYEYLLSKENQNE